MVLLLLYIQLINSVMGKKLRNRELLSQTDQQNADEQNQNPITHSISKNDIRKKLYAQHYIHKKYNKHKQNRFRQRLITRQLGDIINQSTFECSICLQLIISPMMLRCGHVYCARCLESNAAYTKRCCLCRQEQEEQPWIPLKMATKLIENFILPTYPQTIKYLCRTTDSIQWLRRRKLNNFKQCLIIDFQDHDGKWRKGVISKNIDCDEIEVKTITNTGETFQKIKKSSSRIAPFTFFTRGRYLQDFPTTLPQHDPTQHQLFNLQYRPIPNDQDLFSVIQPSHLQQPQEVYNQEVRDEVLQLFNFQMRENDFIFDME